MELFLKAYCHLRNEPAQLGQPAECAEVSLQGTPDALRAIAEFIIDSADKMEKVEGSGIVHFHLREVWDDWMCEYPDVIVASSPKIARE